MSQNIWSNQKLPENEEFEAMSRMFANKLGVSMPNATPVQRRPSTSQFAGHRSTVFHTAAQFREEFAWTDEERAERARQRRLQEKRKTSLCTQFMKTGTCDFGPTCRFAHGVDELRLMPESKNFKTKLCRNFERDQFCPYGERCQFIHRRKGHF